ncbi:sulfite exporter TauE/SafE family protein [Nostoc sp. FACHB-110]|uniref:sulfite exporter TauE/SafE family protein n=1 Tax=Nostoc sp. FACHB-110 TaxID=2692834 RepID=UPI001688FA60|nr:sulfite exporter TauE/SafE family protein [Nostoc sp. FACHB-110]MBD2439142.1 sulfite exporter TauE/SafE family protein [Nostoc sp. FACHB-110]
MTLSGIIGYFLAVCVGLSLGLIGGGGSILAVPVLIYVMGVQVKSAIAMSLVIVGVVSLIGIVPHWQQGNVNFKIAVLFAPGAMLGAYIGARMATLPLITPTIQLGLFISMMLLAAYFMIQNSNHEPVPAEVDTQITQEKSSHFPSWFAIPLEGLGVGIITGLVGTGGGFMIIPALVLLGNTPIRQAIGTSLAIIVFKSISGFIGYLGSIPVDINLMLTFSLAASAGMLIGAYLTQFLEAKQLEKGFGYFVILVAIFMLLKWQ